MILTSRSLMILEMQNLKFHSGLLLNLHFNKTLLIRMLVKVEEH